MSFKKELKFEDLFFLCELLIFFKINFFGFRYLLLNLSSRSMKLFLKRFPCRKIKDRKKRGNIYWKVFKLSQVYPRLDVDGGGSKRKQWGPSSARSRVGLISHYPDRWCIIPILCRVTGSAAARIVAIVVPREKLESTGEWEWEERKKKGGGEKKKRRKMERKRGGVERWRKKKKTSRGGWRSSRLR